MGIICACQGVFVQEAPTMNSNKADRRGFLKRSAALAGLAAGAIPFANGNALASAAPDEPKHKRGVAPDDPDITDLLCGERSEFENSVRIPSVGWNGATGLRNL